MIINENSQCVRGSITHKLIISRFSSHCSNDIVCVPKDPWIPGWKLRWIVPPSQNEGQLFWVIELYPNGTVANFSHGRYHQEVGVANGVWSAPSLNHSQFLITGIKRYSCGGNWDKHPFSSENKSCLEMVHRTQMGGILFVVFRSAKTNGDQRHPMILVPSSSCHQRCLVILLAHLSPRKVGSQMQ